MKQRIYILVLTAVCTLKPLMHQDMVNVLKFRTLLSIVKFRAVIDKMLFIIANREDPDQTASSEAV